MPTGNSGSFRRGNAKICTSSHSAICDTITYQNSPNDSFLGFQICKKKKKNQKTKNHKKSLSLFPTLPTGNSGSFRRKNAKVCTSPFISNCTLSYLRDLYAKYSSSYNNKIFFTKNEKINKYKLFCGKITTLSVYFAAIR